MRVHELAKVLGMTSKDLMARIKQLGGSVKTHMSVVDEELLSLIQGKIESGQQTGGQAGEAVESTGAKAGAAEAGPGEEHKKQIAAAIKEEEATVEGGAIRIKFPITVGNFSSEIKVRVPELIKALMGIGIFANINQLLNEAIGAAVAEKLAISIEGIPDEADAILSRKDKDELHENLKPRPPVVTMMGHVDHGKTSLLDAIRKTNVAGGERGAITQHIGAYNVEIPGKGQVTFLDTPGHEAFTAMRARGANITDVVVLVVAADDGVMPQTIEAIDHAREAQCPIVVAMNKSDLPTANPQKVLQQLQKLDLVAEEWGGKTIIVKVSAKTGAGLDKLLDMLLLEAEVLELKANPDREAIGTVIEGHLSKGAGPVATVIVQRGTLRQGEMVVCGQHMGRVRYMRNDQGRNLKEAGPSVAVELSGLSGVPGSGDIVYAVPDEKTARKITTKKALEIREREMSGAAKHLSLAELYDRITEGNFKELKLVIKADVQGSVEALTQSLEKVSSERCRVRVIHGGTGGINESDIMLAAASDAIIIGFHVKADSQAERLGQNEGVDIHYYHIIYEAVENVRLAMEGLLDPTLSEVTEGRIEIRRIFTSSKVGTIGGGIVIKGKVTRTHPVRVLRDNVVVHEGRLGALRRFKDDVREVAEGYECGVSFPKFDDLKEGDVVESYRIEKTATKL
ncbi:MAG: translation initiation factor IF-2 [Candidatus Omnitrophota bacterium]|nr:translation initiation factor IF-2 [Candidatus Omnitrophota bacterium]